MISRTMWQS